MARLSQSTRDAVRAGSIASARAVWPLIIAELPIGEPGSVLDVGAGEGHWLDAAVRIGMSDCLGVDLMPLGYQTTGESQSEGVTLWHWNAEDGVPLPTRFEASGLDQAAAGEKWDVALCLETAEHVSPGAGDWLVAELCRVARAVVWSAAIPGQGGDGHVNEQWPSYWQERFWAHGWTLFDPFREALWSRGDVEPWYAQNTLLAVPVADAPHGIFTVRHLVHPTTWAHYRGVSA